MKKTMKPCDIGLMAIINPRMCRDGDVRLEIEIEEQGEGAVPHLHVYPGQERDLENCVFVRLDKPEYFTHNGIPSKTFDEKQKQRFIEIMTAKWRSHGKTTETGLRVASGYEAAVWIWMENYDDKYPDVKFITDSEGFPIMPDYSKL